MLLTRKEEGCADLDSINVLRRIRRSSHSRPLALGLVLPKEGDLQNGDGHEDQQRREADEGDVPREDEGDNHGPEQVDQCDDQSTRDESRRDGHHGGVGRDAGGEASRAVLLVVEPADLLDNKEERDESAMMEEGQGNDSRRRT